MFFLSGLVVADNLVTAVFTIIFRESPIGIFIKITSVSCHLPHLGKPVGKTHVSFFAIYEDGVVVLVVGDFLYEVVQVVLFTRYVEFCTGRAIHGLCVFELDVPYLVVLCDSSFFIVGIEGHLPGFGIGPVYQAVVIIISKCFYNVQVTASGSAVELVFDGIETVAQLQQSGSVAGIYMRDIAQEVIGIVGIVYFGGSESGSFYLSFGIGFL